MCSPFPNIRSLFVSALLSALLSSLVIAGTRKERPLDRALDKLASAMLQEHPELKGAKRSRLAKEDLIKEFGRLGADDISEKVFRGLKRRKVDYANLQWNLLVGRFERASLDDTKCVFLLKKAKQQKMNGVEHYVVSKLMAEYFDEQIRIREELSKRNLQAIGKAYSEFLKSQKSEPRALKEFVSDSALLQCVNPLTGEQRQWIYVGGESVPILGANRYRVVAYSPFGVGQSEGYRWVGYKGGRVSEWKAQTVLDKHALMKKTLQDNRLNSQRKIDLKAQQQRESERLLEESKKLKITITELW